jgi:hypothetical protein
LSFTIRSNIEVVPAVGVVVGTVSFLDVPVSSLAIHVPHVVIIGPEEEVMRIATRRVIAGVEYV